jgi:hypothetical protein
VRYCVVMPTFRGQYPEVAATIGQVTRSFTYPTEFFVLDGSDGKVPALHQGLQQHGHPDRYDLYVTLDDDLELPENWQHFLARAFAVMPRLGAAGIDLTDTEEGRAYVMEPLLGPVEQLEDVVFRRVPHHNIAGCLVAMRMDLARAVGNAPDQGVKYDLSEDGWRCAQVRALGWEMVYVVTPTKCRLIHYPDYEGYGARKARDIEIMKRRLRMP